MSNMIGKEGGSKNFSKATSAVNRVADIERIEKYDEFKVEKKTKFSIWMFIFIIIGVRLIMKDHFFWGGLMIVLPVILFVFKRVTYVSPVEVYKNGLITPAMITGIDNEGIELLYLAPMNKDSSSKIIFGCKKKKVKELPETNVQIGERIPCVSVFYPFGNMKGCWGDFDSRPLVWGFKDKHIIESAIFSLENDEDYEENCWSTIEKLAVIMETKAYDTLIYFDGDLEIVSGTSDGEYSEKKNKENVTNFIEITKILTDNNTESVNEISELIDNPDKFTERNKIWLQEMELSAYTDAEMIIPYWLVGYDLDESHGIYGIYIDWKEETSEIIDQLNDIIAEKKYTIDLSQITFKEEFTDEVLEMIDKCLSKQNYRLVCWDTDSDSYHLFIISSAHYDDLKKLGESLNIKFYTNYVS